MVRRLLDFSDDGLAVGLEGARNNHEAGKLQVTLQSIAAHLPDLKKKEKKDPVQSFGKKSLMALRTNISLTNLLVTEVSYFFVTQGEHSGSFARHFLVDFVITFRKRRKLQLRHVENTSTLA